MRPSLPLACARQLASMRAIRATPPDSGCTLGPPVSARSRRAPRRWQASAAVLAVPHAVDEGHYPVPTGASAGRDVPRGTQNQRSQRRDRSTWNTSDNPSGARPPRFPRSIGPWSRLRSPRPHSQPHLRRSQGRAPFRRGSQRLAGSASPRPTSRWVPRPARRASSRRLPVPRGTAAELARCAQPPRVPFVRQPGLLRLLHCLPRRSCYAAPLCGDLPSSSPAPSPRDPVEPCHSRTRWRPPCQPTEGARRRQPPPLPVRKDVPVPLLTERDDNLHGPSYLENRAERRGGAVEAIAPPHQPEAPERARDPRHHPSCPPPTPAWPAPP